MFNGLFTTKTGMMVLTLHERVTGLALVFLDNDRIAFVPVKDLEKTYAIPQDSESTRLIKERLTSGN